MSSLGLHFPPDFRAFFASATPPAAILFAAGLPGAAARRNAGPAAFRRRGGLRPPKAAPPLGRPACPAGRLPLLPCPWFSCKSIAEKYPPPDFLLLLPPRPATPQIPAFSLFASGRSPYAKKPPAYSLQRNFSHAASKNHSPCLNYAKTASPSPLPAVYLSHPGGVS